MHNQKFSKKEAIKFGWNTVIANFLFFLSILIISGILSFIFGKVAKELEQMTPLFSFLISVGGWIVSMFINMGILYIALRFVDNNKPTYANLFTPAKHIISFTIASILYVLIVFIGLVLFIIPGIIWGIRYGQYKYLVIDKELGPIEALKKSAEITQGSKWNLFLLGILLGLINVLGVLAFGLGLLVTMPLSIVVTAYVYRRLLGVVIVSSDTKNTEVSPQLEDNSATQMG